MTLPSVYGLDTAVNINKRIGFFSRKATRTRDLCFLLAKMTSRLAVRQKKNRLFSEIRERKEVGQLYIINIAEVLGGQWLGQSSGAGGEKHKP